MGGAEKGGTQREWLWFGVGAGLSGKWVYPVRDWDRKWDFAGEWAGLREGRAAVREWGTRRVGLDGEKGGAWAEFPPGNLGPPFSPFPLSSRMPGSLLLSLRCLASLIPESWIPLDA